MRLARAGVQRAVAAAVSGGSAARPAFLPGMYRTTFSAGCALRRTSDRDGHARSRTARRGHALVEGTRRSVLRIEQHPIETGSSSRAPRAGRQPARRRRVPLISAPPPWPNAALLFARMSRQRTQSGVSVSFARLRRARYPVARHTQARAPGSSRATSASAPGRTDGRASDDRSLTTAPTRADRDAIVAPHPPDAGEREAPRSRLRRGRRHRRRAPRPASLDGVPARSVRNGGRFGGLLRLRRRSPPCRGIGALPWRAPRRDPAPPPSRAVRVAGGILHRLTARSRLHPTPSSRHLGGRVLSPLAAAASISLAGLLGAVMPLLRLSGGQRGKAMAQQTRRGLRA